MSSLLLSFFPQWLWLVPPCTASVCTSDQRWEPQGGLIGEKKTDKPLLSLLHFACLAPWWRWEWVEVHSQSAITSRWKLASKKVYFPQKPHIMMVPPEHTVVVKLITANCGIISVSFYANSYHWRSVIKILMKTLEISENNKHKENTHVSSVSVC